MPVLPLWWCSWQGEGCNSHLWVSLKEARKSSNLCPSPSPFPLPPLSDLERGSCMKCIYKYKCVYSWPDCKGDFTYPLRYHFPPCFITFFFPSWNKVPRYSLHAGRVWSGHAGDGRLFICMCFVHTPYEITTGPSLQPCLQREKVTRLAVCVQWIEDTQSIYRGYILYVLREKLTRAIHYVESISARIERLGFGFKHRW